MTKAHNDDTKTLKNTAKNIHENYDNILKIVKY